MLTTEKIKLVLDLVETRYVFEPEAYITNQHHYNSYSTDELAIIVDNKPIVIIDSGLPFFLNTKHLKNM